MMPQLAHSRGMFQSRVLVTTLILGIQLHWPSLMCWACSWRCWLPLGLHLLYLKYKAVHFFPSLNPYTHFTASAVESSAQGALKGILESSLTAIQRESGSHSLCSHSLAGKKVIYQSWHVKEWMGNGNYIHIKMKLNLWIILLHL